MMRSESKETPQILQKIINTVNEIGKQYGMKINANKTKVMMVSRNLWTEHKEEEEDKQK